MATVAVYNMKGEETGTIDLSDAIFAVKPNEHAVHMSVVQYLANQRQGTKGTKTRAEVRGGGRKPWRQKGSGRARQGSTRSPQWTGGGVVFAPKARDYSIKLNKKQKRLALKSALSSKVLASKLIVLENLAFPEIKTKEMAKVCANLDITSGLFVVDHSDTNAMLSARNISTIKTAAVNTINVYDILKYDKFAVTKEAVAKLEEVYS
ncbi:MAG: 50S ribosomal protein L4 [Turicibacter sp.]|nr:50S ribosomal protein L4 [Turicibacter sp.]